MYLTVVLVLVLAVALIGAGADTYDCIHWGYFQQETASTTKTTGTTVPGRLFLSRVTPEG